MSTARNAIIKAKIEDVITELMVKTNAANVYVDDTTTLAAKLTTIIADIATKASTDDLATGLAGKAAASHTHAQSDITGLTDALAAKANTADLGTMASETAANYIKKTEAVGYDDILTATAAGATYETKTDASSKLTAAKEYTNTELGKLVLTEVSAGEGQIIDKISQANGKVSASTRAIVAADIPALAIDKITGLQAALDAKAVDGDLARIAKTGSVMDLVQNTGDVLIFDCGNSTEG